MKYHLRVPTNEQYAYIEAEMEGDSEQAIDEYYKLTRALKPKEGLPDKDYNAFIDNQLLGESNQLETYTQMSDQQKNAVQIIKRALARIKARQTQE